MKIVDSHPHIYSKKIDKFPSIKDPWQPGQPSSAEDLKKIMDELKSILYLLGFDLEF